jgi:glycogen debranching enzyme
LFFHTEEHIPVILSDYFGLEDGTRDMLIALPGLTLVTQRYDEARRILRNLACYFKQGLLPDRLPSRERPLEEHDYGSVDTTLWYFYTLDQYLRATHDYEFLDDLYQRLVESIDWYIRGTYNGIQVDARDGLLRANQPGKALTWMNASVYGVPVTPRQGKPVEVNALWYQALSLMHEWAQRQQTSHASTCHAPSYYEERAAHCKRSFHQRFWYPAGGHLYDVIDGPGGDETSFRPNQLLALSLHYPVLDKEYRQAIFASVTEQLVTPYGLRTLAPQEAEYQGQLKESQEEQQRALHQGSVWPWLIGPYIDAMLSTMPACTANESQQQGQQETLWQNGLAVLEPFRKQFSIGLLGMIGGVYSGDVPQQVEYKVTSALSVGEILRVYNLFIQQEARQSINLLNSKRVSSIKGESANTSGPLAACGSYIRAMTKAMRNQEEKRPEKLLARTGNL